MALNWYDVVDGLTMEAYLLSVVVVSEYDRSIYIFVLGHELGRQISIIICVWPGPNQQQHQEQQKYLNILSE